LDDEEVVMRRAIIPALIAVFVPWASAFAADVPLPPPVMQTPVMPIMMPAPVEAESRWYLRGDVGVGAVQSAGVDWQPNPLNNFTDFTIQSFGMGDQAFLNVGAGYEFNNWLRFDFTAEYRTKASFNFWGGYTVACPNPYAQCLDVYNGFISSYVFLANAYVDLGTWCGLTPFVGFGIGTAANTISGFSDVGIPTGGAGIGAPVTDWDLAWAVHAGVSYSITPNLKLELAYRFLDLGSVTSSINCVGGCNPDSYRFHNLEFQDLMIGFRWMFEVGPSYASAPPQLIAPMPQYMAPAPMMAPPMMGPPMMMPQPPLSTRG
jgi:opacity protein-like surface antigen